MVIPGQPSSNRARKSNDHLDTLIPVNMGMETKPFLNTAILVPTGLLASILLLASVWWLGNDGAESCEVVPPPLSSSNPAPKPAKTPGKASAVADAKGEGATTNPTFNDKKLYTFKKQNRASEVNAVPELHKQGGNQPTNHRPADDLASLCGASGMGEGPAQTG